MIVPAHDGTEKRCVLQLTDNLKNHGLSVYVSESARESGKSPENRGRGALTANCETIFFRGCIQTVYRKTIVQPSPTGILPKSDKEPPSALPAALLLESGSGGEDRRGGKIDMASMGKPSAGRAAGCGTACRRRRCGTGRPCRGARLADRRSGSEAALKDKDSQIALAFQLCGAYTGIG